MPNSTLLLLSPLLLPIVVLGIAWIIALVRARPEDVPTVLNGGGTFFRRLTERLPQRHNVTKREEDR
ncbi:hypothetical protein [Actinocrispum sp. NPDC049592]|uniref:hypothetical protein n=1 Tax=Actinocrispum sp. NPDC049592 TaxID=3154835 RepID=UPI00343491B3